MATTDYIKIELKNQMGAGELLHLNLNLWGETFPSLKYIVKKYLDVLCVGVM